MRHRVWLEVAEKEGGLAQGSGRLPWLPGEGPRAGLQSIWEGRREGTEGRAGWGWPGEGRKGRAPKVRMRDELHPRPGLGDKKKKSKAKPVLPKGLPSRLHLGEMSLETHAGAEGEPGPRASLSQWWPDAPTELG